MIMIAENIVSRGSADLSLPPASIIETISATSITVTATARTSVPNGSPTRCATTSAWCTEASTEPHSAGTAAAMKIAPTGSTNARPTSPSESSGRRSSRQALPRPRVMADSRRRAAAAG